MNWFVEVNAAVRLFEAKTRLSELVEQVASGGDDFIITRRGKPVARLLPMADTESSVEHALELLLAAREASVTAPGSLRELIDDGRTQ